jgi:hypothetical protein
MNIGVCRIVIRIPENHSLKGKRQIIKSIIGKLQQRYAVSVAEVEDNDLWQLATLGISCVSNHRQHSDTVLNNIVNYIARHYPNIEILDYQVEIFNTL